MPRYMEGQRPSKAALGKRTINGVPAAPHAVAPAQQRQRARPAVWAARAGPKTSCRAVEYRRRAGMCPPANHIVQLPPRRSPVSAGAWRDQNPTTGRSRVPGLAACVQAETWAHVGMRGGDPAQGGAPPASIGRRGRCPKTWRGTDSELRFGTTKKMKSCAAQSNVLLSQSVTTSIPRKRVDRPGADVDFSPWKPHRSGALLLAQSMCSHMQSSQRSAPKA